MNTKIIKTITITNTEEWFLAASPQGGKRQWKDGYSSKELARFVTENKQDFHNLIQDVINEEGINCNFFECEPEACTRLPYSHRGPRQHDLLMKGKNVIIGIEAKAKESFGEYGKGSKDKELRLKWMRELLFPNSKNDIKDIPYQLLTGISGTLLEAKRSNNNINNCIFLVIMFKHDKGNKKNIDNINNFIEKLGAEKGIIVNVKEPGEEEGKVIKCWVKKRIIEYSTVKVSQ